MAEQTLPIDGSMAAPPAELLAKRKNIIALVREWPIYRKLALAAVVVISLLLFAILIFQGRSADYQLLYANLTENDASQVVTWLKGEKIPYDLQNGGRNIWVPAKNLYETRLDLAANGLPVGAGVGFEVFDKQSFALTDYVQKVNYTRALQGELSRTIASLDPVNSARVHLALPEGRLFKDQEKQATASVTLSLVEGKALQPQQVMGIIHLVSGSITGLKPENITIIDSNGVVLDSGENEEKDQLLSVDMLAYQKEVEKGLEMRAQSLLDKTMGRDKAMVRISATLDFSKVEKTQELFDAEEPVIRSEQVNQESTGIPITGGVPGVQSNLQGTGAQSTGDNISNRTSRTTNYEISKTTSRIINPVGTIEKLSVSILVADKIVAATETSPETVVPRTAEELLSLKTLVAGALGIVPERGDQINVLSMPFTDSPDHTADVDPLPTLLLYDYLPLAKIGLIFIGSLLLYLLLVRPIIKTIRGEVKEQEKNLELTEQEKLAEEKSREMLERKQEESIIEDPLIAIRKEVMANPIPTAHIIKNWLQET